MGCDNYSSNPFISLWFPIFVTNNKETLRALCRSLYEVAEYTKSKEREGNEK